MKTVIVGQTYSPNPFQAPLEELFQSGWFNKFDIRYLDVNILELVGVHNLRGDAFISGNSAYLDSWTEANENGIGVWIEDEYSDVEWYPKKPTRILVVRDLTNDSPYDKALRLLERTWI